MKKKKAEEDEKPFFSGLFGLRVVFWWEAKGFVNPKLSFAAWKCFKSRQLLLREEYKQLVKK